MEWQARHRAGGFEFAKACGQYAHRHSEVSLKGAVGLRGSAFGTVCAPSTVKVVSKTPIRYVRVPRRWRDEARIVGPALDWSSHSRRNWGVAEMRNGLPSVDEARAVGYSLGSRFPNIWEPDWLATARIRDGMTEWLSSIPRKRSTGQRVWLTALALSVIAMLGGVGTIGWMLFEVNPADLPLEDTRPVDIAAALFLGGAIGVLVTVIGNSLTRTRAGRRREVQLARAHEAALSEAIQQVQRRRAEKRSAAVPPPSPAPLGLSAQGRINLAAAWLRFLNCPGEIDSRRRHGVDIFTAKHLVRVVDESEDAKTAMRDIAEVAQGDGLRTAVVMLADPPPEALVDAANAATVAVFIMTAEDGSLVALTDAAHTILARSSDPEASTDQTSAPVAPPAPD